MSYFTTRPRAYSKPTREETKELSQYLAKCSPQELRCIIMSAANESSEMAALIMRVVKDANLTAQPYFQPVQIHQQHIMVKQSHLNTGLLTPTDISDDSEMSGTENIQPEVPHGRKYHTDPFVSVSPNLAFFNPPQHETPPSKRCNKRKSLADRDDNLPSQSYTPRFPPSTKRRKQSIDSSDVSTAHTKTHCVNCGLWTSTSKFENLHGCQYHPGTFELGGTVCSWSCCGNAEVRSRGCLITRHREIAELAGASGDGGDTAGFSCEDGYIANGSDAGFGHGLMSQYARLVSING